MVTRFQRVETASYFVISLVIEAVQDQVNSFKDLPLRS